MKPGADIRICNVVSTFKLDRRMDLSSIHQAYPDISIWEDRVFMRLVIILRLKRPKMSLLVYETGKAICSGAESVKDALESGKILIKMLRRAGIPADLSEPPVVNNIVAVGSYERSIDLEALAMSLEGVEYEPEQFPGASMSIENPRTTFLIFPTGKIVSLGCKNEQEVLEGLKALYRILNQWQPD